MPGKSKNNASSRERLFLLDGMALAYRAYFSFINRPLVNSRGENTSAIFGFVNALMKILNEDAPEHIAVVFDTKEPTFRHVMYDQYKATREKMPEDMAGQIDKLKDVVRAFNVPVIELAGYEADDIMGTLARKAERENIETLLVTGDKDFMQLVSPHVRIYRPGKQGDQWEILDAKAVLEKFGVEPSHVVDVLALTGDKSDNVPGVYGVGDKTAIPLVREFGTVENLLANVDRIPQKGLQQKLREHSANALLSKKLVTIDVNVPIDVDLHHLTAKPKNLTLLLHLFGELEFNSLRRKIAAESPEPADHDAPEPTNDNFSTLANVSNDYEIISTEKELRRLAAQLKKSGKFVFDTETTSTEPLLAELVGISFCIKPGEAAYVPVVSGEPSPADQQDLFEEGKRKGRSKKTQERVLPPSRSDQTGFSLDTIRSVLAPIFSDAAIAKIGQNIKYDTLVLSSHGIETNGILFDTMVAHYILRPDAAHNMDSMAMEVLSYRPISYDDLTGTGKDRRDMREIDLSRVAEYSSEDADVTFRLYETLAEKLKEEKLLSLCEEIEFPLISVLASMEKAGIALDVEYLSGLSKEMERQLDILTSRIYELAGDKFNINSTQQLSKVLFQQLKLNAVRKTKTGYSTDVGVLETLRHEHPIIEQLLEYRQLQKLKSTYIDALPTLINPKTARVHTSFNQTVAATGRLSSSNPNLQNIPIRTEIGRNIRKAFIPGSPRAHIMSADYSQIELRIMAHVSDDEGLKEAFRNHEDIHATTAAKVFGVDLKDVSKDMRRKAKEVNFGIMYGIGPFGLANRLDISQVEAKEIISTYFARFPRVNQYIGDTILKARTDGYVCTLLNRRRYLPEINSRNFNLRGNAERQAINMPIQGTAADMIKIAMVKIHRALAREKVKATMLLQVHDELVFETEIKEKDRASKLVSREMVNALPLSVPVEVDIGVGKHWLEAH